jgi:hypothetical protein
MHVPAQIQSIIEHARALTGKERQALRAELLAAAAELGLQTSNKPARRSDTTVARLRWPRVGGWSLVVEPNMTVESDDYQRRWQASDVIVWIYVLGCPGTQALAKALGLPLFKVGTTGGRVQDRLRELGRDAYGGCYQTADGKIVREQGFSGGLWVAEQTPVTLNLSPLSPIHPSTRGIGVRLPVGMSAAMFEKRLTAQIATASLGKLIASPAGQALCAERGADPARCRRITEYRFGSDIRPSSEEEFTIFRPRSESDRLVAIAERIVVRHVMGEAQ